MTTAQDILAPFPSDMEPEEWELVLPGLQARLKDAQAQVEALTEARNQVMERVLADQDSKTLEGWTYRRVTKRTYSEVKLARDYPEIVDAIKADLREAYKPKLTKTAIDKELHKLPDEERLAIELAIMGDSEVTFSATPAKAKGAAE